MSQTKEDYAGPAEAAAVAPSLAWCGWSLRLPPQWRPLRVEGDGRTGNMMVGSATDATLRIRWARLSPARARRAWARRVRRAKGQPLARTPGGFTDCAILKPHKSAQTVWLGIAEEAGLLLDLVYNSAGDAKYVREIERVVLPSLAAEPLGTREGSHWAIFGARFVTPPGFTLLGQSLHLGEISLRLARGKDRLSVGQVYPSDLALARRPLKFWLRSWPWEKGALRRYREIGDVEMRDATLFPAGNRVVSPISGPSLLRLGRKRIRWPLGFLAPRRVVSAAVVDEQRGRILRAELESPGQPEESIVRDAILRMDASPAGVK
jgi:hypothetical protein